jgi:hypothetical protein
LKSYLSKEFSRLENLWVGEKKENQQKGSNFGAAEKELKGLKEGTPEYKAALARRSAAVVDPAKGTASGKKISSREQGWIDQIDKANSDFGRFNSLFKNGKLGQSTIQYEEADDIRTRTINSQQNLGDFSGLMNSSEFTKVNSSLAKAASTIHEYNRILIIK